MKNSDAKSKTARTRRNEEIFQLDADPYSGGKAQSPSETNEHQPIRVGGTHSSLYSSSESTNPIGGVIIHLVRHLETKIVLLDSGLAEIKKILDDLKRKINP